MKLACLLLSLVFSISSLAATSKNVSYKSGDDTVQGILYTPEGKGPFPALVVIHEWWGLNDWVKEQAAQACRRGLCGAGGRSLPRKSGDHARRGP